MEGLREGLILCFKTGDSFQLINSNQDKEKNQQLQLLIAVAT